MPLCSRWRADEPFAIPVTTSQGPVGYPDMLQSFYCLATTCGFIVLWLLVVLALVVAAGMGAVRTGSTVVREWAESEGYSVLRSSTRLLGCGTFFWHTSVHVSFCLELQDSSGLVRTACVRVNCLTRSIAGRAGVRSSLANSGLTCGNVGNVGVRSSVVSSGLTCGGGFGRVLAWQDV